MILINRFIFYFITKTSINSDSKNNKMFTYEKNRSHLNFRQVVLENCLLKQGGLGKTRQKVVRLKG